jgi:hypothetical protein
VHAVVAASSAWRVPQGAALPAAESTGLGVPRSAGVNPRPRHQRPRAESATALAGFYAHLTSRNGPVRQLLGPELHADFLATKVCGYDQIVGTSVGWTLGPLRSDSIIGLGGLGGSAAWWSLRNQHAVAYATRRLHGFSRAAEIAAALGDDITIEVMCQ